MYKNAKDYLESITKPLTHEGVEILEELTDEGVTYVVIPKHSFGYGQLIGVNGEHAEAIRTLMSAWWGENMLFDFKINVMIPNPRLMKVEYI